MSKQILVIEDNAENRRLITILLQHHGYDIIEAKNGAEGITKAQEHKPDLVLMDIQMPVMDGFDALKIIRSTPGIDDIKIMAVTSFAMKGDREKSLAAGFDEYVTKPIDTRQLPKVIRRLLP